MVGGPEKLVRDCNGARGGLGHILFGCNTLFETINEVLDLGFDAAVGCDLDILDRAVFL